MTYAKKLIVEIALWLHVRLFPYVTKDGLNAWHAMFFRRFHR
jgi:hypothetical protein